MDNNYSTGQVSGMTRIPIRTIQDYVKDFRENFSEAARQPSKGRRFIDADIDTILTIKRLRWERTSDDDIRKVLSGEIEIKLAHQYKDDEIKKMAANSLEVFEAAMQTLKQFDKLAAENQKTIDRLAQENYQLREDNKAWKSRVEKLHEWQLWVMTNFEELNPAIFESENPQEQDKRKKSFFSKLLGLR